jgi:hypothetical protein
MRQRPAIRQPGSERQERMPRSRCARRRASSKLEPHRVPLFPRRARRNDSRMSTAPPCRFANLLGTFSIPTALRAEAEALPSDVARGRAAVRGESKADHREPRTAGSNPRSSDRRIATLVNRSLLPVQGALPRTVHVVLDKTTVVLDRSCSRNTGLPVAFAGRGPGSPPHPPGRGQSPRCADHHGGGSLDSQTWPSPAISLSVAEEALHCAAMSRMRLKAVRDAPPLGPPAHTRLLSLASDGRGAIAAPSVWQARSPGQPCNVRWQGCVWVGHYNCDMTRSPPPRRGWQFGCPR